jgi:hypothetical protein
LDAQSAKAQRYSLAKCHCWTGANFTESFSSVAQLSETQTTNIMLFLVHYHEKKGKCCKYNYICKRMITNDDFSLYNLLYEKYSWRKIVEKKVFYHCVRMILSYLYTFNKATQQHWNENYLYCFEQPKRQLRGGCSY